LHYRQLTIALTATNGSVVCLCSITLRYILAQTNHTSVVALRKTLGSHEIWLKLDARLQNRPPDDISFPYY